ncbi:MAG: GNAT family N-acetyltransferase [Nitrospiraceae bacterium]|nr:GNAT family N-acetyltransferase [Nitrospiraceae bacterium]
MESEHYTDSVPQVNSVFQQPWWLNAIAPERWHEITIKKGDETVLRFPYVTEKKNGFTLMTMPSITQTLGPWMIPMNGKQSSQLSLQKELMTELIRRLPPHDSFYQRFHYSITNWLPFYWQGFSQTTRYTYIIEDLSDLDKVWDAMKSNVRNKIRKAEKSGIKVVDTDDIETFLDLNELTFRRQAMSMPYSRDLVRGLNAACAARNARKIYITYGPGGCPQTGLFCVYDERSMYNLLQGGDPALRGSGANALAIWESIKFASKVTRTYDFEGSMLEPVEEFFRGFGAVQRPYFEISRTTSRHLQIRMHGRKLLGLIFAGGPLKTLKRLAPGGIRALKLKWSR